MKTRSSSGPVKRKLPKRTCIACRLAGTKQGLIRLVRTADDSLDIDLTGKKAGRGAYLCPVRDCWEAGIKGGKLELSLHVRLSPEKRATVLKQGYALIEERAVG